MATRQWDSDAPVSTRSWVGSPAPRQGEPYTSPREASEERKPLGLSLEFQASGTGRNKCQLFKTQFGHFASFP